ncbi:MAG TPA: ABC transporter ATP-binding protein [Gemmatimonadetes bacterium]|jgi:iron complex transport system ATP-binding protein|nr:ABC transporter ATP-binding protein [Gemmatimonadota bacterium]
MKNTMSPIQVSNLTVRYHGTRKPVLEGVQMTVHKSSFHTILGPNGSGKSSLLKTIMGLIKPSSGTVLINGLPISSWTRSELAKKVAVVPQSETFAFPLTVRELVATGRYPYLNAFQAETTVDQRAISTALKYCDIEHLLNRPISALSGGELQRVRIARSLAQEPSILILDEPTANLDIRYEMAIFTLLKALTKREMTVVMITHHLNLASEFSDHILLLRQGQVAADGTPQEVLSESILGSVYQWPIAVEGNPETKAPQVRPLSRMPEAHYKAFDNSQTDSNE